MADQQLGNLIGHANANAGSGVNRSNVNGAGAADAANGADPQIGSFDTDVKDISAMRTRLAAIDAGFYTAARLNSMLVNDMIYAIRLNDNPGTIKQ